MKLNPNDSLTNPATLDAPASPPLLLNPPDANTNASTLDNPVSVEPVEPVVPVTKPVAKTKSSR
jgi:hypothetical protein